MYTLVQHSAWVANQDPTFEKALESRKITAAQAEKVVKAGGEVFADYMEAEDFADREQYPASNTGLIPRVEGTFSRTVVDGAPVYVRFTCKVCHEPLRQGPRTVDFTHTHGDLYCGTGDGAMATPKEPF